MSSLLSLARMLRERRRAEGQHVRVLAAEADDQRYLAFVSNIAALRPNCSSWKKGSRRPTTRSSRAAATACLDSCRE